MENVSAHWFRHGLRLHDNPALLEGFSRASKVFAFFTFDGESAGTGWIGYNRMKFICESLADLDRSLRSRGGRLWIFQKDVTTLLSAFKSRFSLTNLSFERDSEAVWQNRDCAVRQHCASSGIDLVEKVSLTLWDPDQILDANGGLPPLTMVEFLSIAKKRGDPERPVDSENVDYSFFDLETAFANDKGMLDELCLFPGIPTPEDFGILPEPGQEIRLYIGGETRADELLIKRLQASSVVWTGMIDFPDSGIFFTVEKNAMQMQITQPNHAFPNLIAPPMSLSPYLRYGCLSIRKFYWLLLDMRRVGLSTTTCTSALGLVMQLMWREYFYCMSTRNPGFGRIEGNQICLPIPWSRDESSLNAWKLGVTGFPFIDAAMRQVRREGWIHHVARNACAQFLTRGGLWISWEEGLRHFLFYLLDGDWSVCSGNWLWLSSSSFEKMLDCSECFSPSMFGRRLDPAGDYVRKYVPELSGMPTEYLHEPWLAPLEVQKKAGCILGEHYPKPMIDFVKRSKRNARRMANFRRQLGCAIPRHCAPSSEEEAREFMWSTAATSVFGHHSHSEVCRGTEVME
ncbi:unnamed protein product [Notodromas monacha]|uniref:Cryptochrome-1 n=1 Tax=Notodromas monacha TaxID=399045 RepID=A0A7R9BE02_9CRUS|nr:unnamed protein product [Notodromas monacha]CAG0913646.1 unnamed protein product [Notodromas monacha]